MAIEVGVRVSDASLVLGVDTFKDMLDDSISEQFVLLFSVLSIAELGWEFCCVDTEQILLSFEDPSSLLDNVLIVL